MRADNDRTREVSFMRILVKTRLRPLQNPHANLLRHFEIIDDVLEFDWPLGGNITRIDAVEILST
jgi:hypothetical protein